MMKFSWRHFWRGFNSVLNIKATVCVLVFWFIYFLIATALAASYSSPDGINGAFAKMTTSGGVLDAGKAFGGVVEVLAGTHIWTKSVFITSAQTLDGNDSATHRIIWMGGPGTAAIVINSYTGPDNGYVHCPIIRNLQIDCSAGGDAIRRDWTARYIDSLEVDHVITNGSVILDGENYRCLLNKCQITVNNKQALVIAGQQNVLRACEFRGTVTADAKVEAVVDISGSASLEGFCGFEGRFLKPALRLRNWGPMRGFVKGSIEWHEQQRKPGDPQFLGTWMNIVNCDYHTTTIGMTSDWPVVLDNGLLLLESKPNAGAVKGTGKLFISGIDTPIASVP